MENKNKPMTVKDGWFCCGADFDCKDPYILVSSENICSEEEKILIPEEVAYYLRTHFCGSRRMRDRIRRNTVMDIRDKIKDALGIE